jgi:uridylate kinase
MRATETLDPSAKYKRVVLKLSGEVLRGGKNGDAIDGPTL